MEDALNRHPQPERPEKRNLDGEQEAHLIALTRSQVPDGYQRWTMRLLTGKLIMKLFLHKRRATHGKVGDPFHAQTWQLAQYS